MNNIKVSVVVPIYNGAKFLEKNLFMLSKQTLEEIEFILVNDASTDDSLNICLAFKEVFPNKFVVINSEKNRGPGGARNIGISYAKGEYIGFMDQDDYCHPDMFKLLYEKAKEKDFDIVSCGYYDKQKDEAYTHYDVEWELDDEKRFEVLKIAYIWNKIFKRTLIENMSERFRENTVNDDIDFTIEALCRAKKAASIKTALYYYNFNGKSTSRNNEVDMDKAYIQYSQLWESIEKRSNLTPNPASGIRFKNMIVKSGIKTMLYNVVLNTNFSFEEFEKYDKFARKYFELYYTEKCENATELRDLIYNCLDEDCEESYKRLSALKEKMVN